MTLKLVNRLQKIFHGHSSDAKSQRHIFVIGFNKTGTTSIHRLFKGNGFNSVHWDRNRLAKTMLKNCLNGKAVLHGYDKKYTVFCDMFYRNKKFFFEGNSLFRELSVDYPDALFLYNTRDIDSWVKSRLNHHRKEQGIPFLDVFKQMLNTEDHDEIVQYWKKTRTRFEADIREFFKDKNNFLELDINDPIFVSKLSKFVGVELDQLHWGKHNKTKELPA